MTPKRRNSPFPNPCKFRFADGRHCALSAAPSLNGFCPAHASTLRPKKSPAEEANLSNEIPSEEGQPLTELGIESALNVIFRALAANRISNRRAATLGYLAHLMLVSKRGTKLLPETDLRLKQFQTLLHNRYSPKPPKPYPGIPQS